MKLKSPTIFGYNVQDPERYGIVQVDNDNNVLSIEEKPKSPNSNYAITGLYIFDKNAPEIAKDLLPSERGETEIVDMMNYYLDNKNLNVELLGRGVTWLDTGTPKSLHEASSYIQVLEERQGLKIGCIEEIAYNKKYISKDQFIKLTKPMKNSEYGKYLIKILNQRI